MKVKLIVICVLAFLAGRVVRAQQQATASTPAPTPAAAAVPRPDPVARNLFAPEVIMGHAEEIGLTSEQRTAIRDEVRKAQTQFTELQWQLEDAVDAMGEVLKPNVVDEKAAMAQLEKVLELERTMKRAQMGLMIRLKNKLTANQQYQLSYFGRNIPAAAQPRNEPPAENLPPVE